MTGEMVFGKDGVLWLRVRHPFAESGDVMVKMQAWDEGDGVLLSRLWDTFEIEDGATMLDVLKALLPWHEQVGHMAQMNILAWVEALEAGLLQPCEDAAKYAGVLLVQRMSLTAEADFSWEKPVAPAKRSRGGFTSFDDVFGKSTPLITDRFETESSWDALLLANPDHDWLADGYDALGEYEKERVFSTSFCEPALLARLPIIVRDTLEITDTSVDAIYLSKENRGGLLNRDNPLVNTSTRYSTITMSDRPTLGGALLRGFLWDIGFYGTPADTAVQGAELLEAKADMDAMLAAEENDDADPSDEAEAEAAAAHAYIDDSDDDGEGADTGKREVVIAPGAMKGLADMAGDDGDDELHERDVRRDMHIMQAVTESRDSVRGLDDAAIEKMAIRLHRYVLSQGHGKDAPMVTET